MTEEDARKLARDLAAAVDAALPLPRVPADPPTDGQVAVMVIFRELDARGYRLIRRN